MPFRVVLVVERVYPRGVKVYEFERKGGAHVVSLHGRKCGKSESLSYVIPVLFIHEATRMCC